MIALTAGEIAEAVGGTLSALDPATIVTGVCVDSRAVSAGALFVAIRGERVDGHDFAAGVVAAGAAAVLSARPLVDPAGGALPCIVVDDPVAALGRLAADVRRTRLRCSVVAITGLERQDEHEGPRRCRPVRRWARPSAPPGRSTPRSACL